MKEAEIISSEIQISFTEAGKKRTAQKHQTNWKVALQGIELPTRYEGFPVCPILLTVFHDGVGFDDAAIFESFMLL